jgi:Spy/CpxP family protein refolding chaperone
MQGTDMKTTRQRVAAALFAACFASFAFAAGEADAPPSAVQPGPGPHGPGMGGYGPQHGPHGAGMHSDGMAGARMPYGDEMYGMHGGLMMRLHQLNLSEDQRDKLFKIMHAAAPEQHERMKAIRKAHDALEEMARADRFDDAKAGAASRELGQAVAAQALLQAKTESQVLAVLSPEQREQMRRHRTPGPQQRPRAPQGAPDAQAPQRRP